MAKTKVWRKKRFWLVLLVFLCLVIIALSISLLFLNNKSDNGGSSTDEDNRVILTDKMEGWDGTISESTQALFFSENVKERLESDEDYDIEDAIVDYENAYNTSSDNLRFNVAIEYSYFILDFTGDLDAAINIMERVEDLIGLDDYNKIYYYNTLYTLCVKADDEVQAQQYKEILDDLVKNWEIPE